MLSVAPPIGSFTHITSPATQAASQNQTACGHSPGQLPTSVTAAAAAGTPTSSSVRGPYAIFMRAPCARRRPARGSGALPSPAPRAARRESLPARLARRRAIDLVLREVLEL